VKPTYFKTPSDFRSWLEKNHATASELWVGFWKKGSGKPSMTWPEAVDQALCFGWIDGVRKGIDDESYMNRFTPRKPRSNWSAVNVNRVRELTAMGLMHPAGMAAFEARDPARSGRYSYEQRHQVTLDPGYERKLMANRRAWTFFTSQPPSYRTAAVWWVMDAKREDTRARRLDVLIEHSTRDERVPPLAGPASRRKR
jgi:uncharacterized protein YdeI (YjbR/CyaY-like superfamily)